MKKLNTLVIASLVAGLTAPVLADTIIKDPVREKYLYGENIVVPVLNDCATSMPLPMGTTTWYGTDHARLWFVWVGSGSGLHLETYFPATNYDTDIRIFAANCPTQLVSKAGPSAQGYRTNLQCADFTFAAGTVYYIRIDEYLNSNIDPTDVCQMFWEDCAPPPPPPANDVASGAYPLELGACVDGDTNAPYTDNTGGYMDDSHLLCPGSTGAAIGSARDAWYYVVLNHAGLYTFDLTGSAYDTVLGVFDANGNLVASNDE
ncbi:MAG: hypothetical protein HZB20_03050, partial [Chloroflexi bacterium]|nr:hypothetical protein [Chloroflexota bacterium]